MIPAINFDSKMEYDYSKYMGIDNFTSNPDYVIVLSHNQKHNLTLAIKDPQTSLPSLYIDKDYSAKQMAIETLKTQTIYSVKEEDIRLLDIRYDDAKKVFVFIVDYDDLILANHYSITDCGWFSPKSLLDGDLNNFCKDIIREFIPIIMVH